MKSTSWNSRITDDGGGNAGCAALFTSSPYQAELTQLQIERLRLEEERCGHLQSLKDSEDARGPVPRWSVYTVYKRCCYLSSIYYTGESEKEPQKFLPISQKWHGILM